MRQTTRRTTQRTTRWTTWWTTQWILILWGLMRLITRSILRRTTRRTTRLIPGRWQLHQHRAMTRSHLEVRNRTTRFLLLLLLFLHLLLPCPALRWTGKKEEGKQDMKTVTGFLNPSPRRDPQSPLTTLVLQFSPRWSAKFRISGLGFVLR